MKYSEVKQVKEFCNNLFSTPDWKEVIKNACWYENDFTVDNVRFIASAEIDSVLADELGNDKYMLGCFNAQFIADVIGIDTDVIEAMQEAEAFEAIGKLIISMNKLEELASAYASADGYGHHFNGYDFSEEEVKVNGVSYYVFDNH